MSEHSDVNDASNSSAGAGFPEPQKQQGGPEAEGAASLEKVREILFGAQSRDYERRFNRLEERLIKESSDLRDELRKRLDSLEVYLKREIESLSERLNVEKKDREDAGVSLANEIRETQKNFDRKTSQLDEALARGHRELREQALEQYKSLTDELMRRYEELSSALARESRELRVGKADRAALAGMFAEVAMRLKDEFGLPGPEGSEHD